MKKATWLVMLVSLVGLVGTTGCPAFLRPAADVLIPVEEERALGEEIEGELHEELEFSDDEVLRSYVEGLGNDIVRRIDERPRGIRFRFYVVDDPEMINAFAVPGGGIYVYTGLIRAMDNEAELTAVLAHEIAHVTRRHIAQRLVAIYGVDLLSRMALGQEPGTVAQIVNAVVQTGMFLRYSRDQERDADAFGVQYHVAAGYNPEAFITFFRKLEAQPSPPTFLSTHPSPRERIENIRQHIREFDRVPSRLEEERFLQMRNRI